jgi:hypothetical protein
VVPLNHPNFAVTSKLIIQFEIYTVISFNVAGEDLVTRAKCETCLQLSSFLSFSRISGLSNIGTDQRLHPVFFFGISNQAGTKAITIIYVFKVQTVCAKLHKQVQVFLSGLLP